VSFIFIEGNMAKINKRRHFCARVLLGNIRRKFSLKNPGFWNAYHETSNNAVWLGLYGITYDIFLDSIQITIVFVSSLLFGTVKTNVSLKT